MSPHHKQLLLLVYTIILNKGKNPCPAVIYINKYWLLPNLIGVEQFPCDLENCSILDRSTYLAIQTPVHEPMPLIS